MSAPGRLWLAGRQLRADPWVSVLIGVVVFLVALVMTAWPRVVDDMHSRQVSHVVNPLSAIQRDLVGVTSSAGYGRDLSGGGTVEESWGEPLAALEELRTSQPEPLRSMLGAGYVFTETQTGTSVDPEAASDYARLEVLPRVDPLLQDRVRLVAGDWPSSRVPRSLGPGTAGEPAADDGPGAEGEYLEVMVSDTAAEKLHWRVGEPVADTPWLLTGTYEAVDPADGYWRHAPNGLDVGELFDGNVGVTGFVSVYLGPANPGTTGNPAWVWDLNAVVPVQADDVPGHQVATAAAQLRSLVSAPVVLRDADPEAGRPQQTQVTFAAEVVPVLQRLADEQHATAAVLSVLAAGPIGVVLAVFALAARLLVTRRQAPLGLALARGASRGQLRWLLGLETALVGLPAALLGYYAAGLVVPRSTGPGELLLAVVVGLVPAAVTAVTAGTAQAVHRRSDLGARSRSRLRWVAEVAVLALAALATWRLLDRGLGGPESGTVAGADPLLAATPLLVALAAALLTLRLYPLPLGLLLRSLRSRPGLTSFLGAARAVRDPSGGVLPALAMLLGVAVAVSATMVASTVSQGAEEAAWEGTGAPIRVAGARALPQVVEDLQSVDGVESVARVTDSTRATELTGASEATSVQVVIVDQELPAVQRSAEHLEALPEQLARDDGEGPVPAVTGGTVPPGTGTAQLSGIGEVELVGHVPAIPGYETPSGFVVVTTEGWERLGRAYPLGNLTLLSVEEGADREQVAAAVREAVPNTAVETPDQQLDAYREAPVTSGLTAMSATAVVLATALTVLAVVLVLLLGAPARARLLAVLRTLGLTARQGRGLAAWELAPLLAASALVGGAVGFAVPWLLVRTVDFRAMTGGEQQPALAADPMLLGLVLGAVLLAVVTATLAAAAVSARADITRHLRIGEER
ncbi:FtsX-like permease family protein [Ornithinicoccus halotolerans]|uniref:FtsX-like permease family protein n=1 Tax=Ornithinicoccus halotolerans TaxID=1748220 RepID=UPI00129523C4|nr:FtsX-like permease family protein [Ornithinicoccus halotolerans]